MTYEDFCPRIEHKRPYKDGFMAVCPAHDDSPKSPSMSIGRGNDGGVVLHCFAGCSIEQILYALNLEMKDLFAETKVKEFRAPTPKPSTKPTGPEVKPVVETIYQYRDSAGRDVYQALRMKPKSFRQRHMVDGQWVWNMEGVVRVLYRLPEIQKAKTVWIVEGEKDANNLSELGFEATCNVGGAGKWLDGYTESLAGKDVIICGDNDKAGGDHVNLVFESIAGAAKSVKIVKLPAHVKDVSDYIATFKLESEAIAALQDMVAAAHPHLKGVSLPIYTIGELEQDYKRFVQAMDTNSFSLSKWLPSFRKIRPLVPGELVFIIGDTGTGKTALLQTLAKAALPIPTLMFEMELPKELMFERFASMTTKFTCSDIEKGYRESISSENTLSDLIDAKLKNLYICTEPRLTVAQIESYIVRSELKIGERPRVVLIDYIQLIGGGGPNRREKISDIAEGLKVMAKATRTIVIVTSQIARNKEEIEPNLHSAKESGSIEASCGLLIGAWKDAKDPQQLNLRVLKSTKGGAGTLVECNFDGAKMIITERSKIYDTDP